MDPHSRNMGVVSVRGPYAVATEARQREDGPDPWTVRPFLGGRATRRIVSMAIAHVPATRSVLVVTPSPERRRDWSAVVSDGRTVVDTCPGPSEHCVLLQGLDTCPLVARCDVVLYDFDATTPSFLAILLRAHRGAEVVLVRDRMVRGQHRPSVVMRRRPRGAAVKPAL